MSKKYKILKNDSITVNGKKLYRIQALRDFGDVKKGDIGGYIQSHKNLSHEGNCWIYDDAKVYENANVYGNARIYDNARVYGNARIYDNARVCGNARIYDNARVFENAWVYGDANVYESAGVFGNANVYDKVGVFGAAKVFGNAEVYDYSIINHNAAVFSYGRVYSSMRIAYGLVKDDMFSNMQKLIYHSLNVYPDSDGNYIFYKRVNMISNTRFASLHDPSFIYEIGKIARVRDYDKDKNTSCGPGLHVSTPDYWDDGDTLIQVQVNIKDVITCLEGKVRCKKLKVLREIE